METYSSILAWKTPWTEEPGGLQSMGSQRAGHDQVCVLEAMHGDGSGRKFENQSQDFSP